MSSSESLDLQSRFVQQIKHVQGYNHCQDNRSYAWPPPSSSRLYFLWRASPWPIVRITTLSWLHITIACSLHSCATILLCDYFRVLKICCYVLILCHLSAIQVTTSYFFPLRLHVFHCDGSTCLCHDMRLVIVDQHETFSCFIPIPRNERWKNYQKPQHMFFAHNEKSHPTIIYN